MKTLGEIADVKGGKRVPKGYKLQSEPTNHPYITVSDFTDDGTIDTTSLRYVSNQIFEQIKRYTITSNDLYLSIAGTIGKTGYVPPELDGASLTENACKLVLRPGVDRNFLYYFTKSDDFAMQAGTNTRTAAQPKLALERLKTIELPVPNSIVDQRRIAGILDEVFEHIATAKNNMEKNLQNSRALFQGYRQSVFCKRGAGWKSKVLGEVATLQRGFDLPTQQRVSGKYPLVSSSGISDTHHISAVHGPGVVTGRSGSIGNVFYIEEDFWPLNTVLYVKDFHNNDPRFVFHLLNHFDLGRFATGAGVPTLNRNFVHDEPVSIPTSINEQQRIAAILDEAFEETQHLETTYKRELDALRALKQSALHEAFVGNL